MGDLFTWPTRRVARAHVQAARLKASAHVPKHVLNTRLMPALPRNWGQPYAFWLDIENWKPAVSRPITPASAGASEGSGLRLDLMFRDHRLSLMRYFTRNRASVTEAEDLAQEAFLRLTNADQSDARIAQPSAYLRQIGRNLMRDRAEKAGRRKEVVAPERVHNATSGENEIGRLEARDRLRRVEEALQRLKPRTREIFLAHRLDGMTYGEIAERTGLSVKGVEKQMSKAIAEVGRIAARLG